MKGVDFVYIHMNVDIGFFSVVQCKGKQSKVERSWWWLKRILTVYFLEVMSPHEIQHFILSLCQISSCAVVMI
jgi:hypothetical protein